MSTAQNNIYMSCCAGHIITPVQKVESAFKYPSDDGSLAYAHIRQARNALDQGQELTVIKYTDAAIEQARLQGAHLLEAWALCLKANSSATIGEHKAAIDIAQEALAIARRENDETLQARALFSLSFCALETHDIDEAQIMLERSLACAQASKSDHDTFWALNNLSHIFGEKALSLRDGADREALSEALSRLQETSIGALNAADRTKDWKHRCYALMNMATGHFVEGNLTRARAVIGQYAKIARHNNFPRLMAYANLDEAQMLAADGGIDEAIKILACDAHLIDLCQTDDLRLRTHDMLASLLGESGNFERAYFHIKQARQLERRVQDTKKERQISLLTAKLQIEEARAEAKRLQAEATALELRNRLLEIDREALKRDAGRDALTGLGNRRSADSELERQMSLFRTSRIPFHLVYVDIDHFKSINDTLGHQTGDQVLVTLAEILQARLRAHDSVYRFGGEEFVVILADESSENASDICERLRLRIQKADWSAVAPELTVTASLGVARAEFSDSIETILARADSALYVAKGNGRNQVVAG